MSCGFITVAGGSRRPFLTTMILIMMIVMMSPYTSATINIKSLEPSKGFEIGSKMNIICEYDVPNFIAFNLLQNGTVVLTIEYVRGENGFKITKSTKDFGCEMPGGNNNGEVKCWKNNLQCKDATDYTCSTSSTDISLPKSLKVKSTIRSLQNDNPPYELYKLSTFRCRADVALPHSTNSVPFQWTVTRGNNLGGTTTTTKSVNVPSRNNCYVTVYSEFEYNVTHEDSSNTTITCTIFSQSLTKTLSVTVPIPATKSPVITNAGGLDGGTIAGIVLGVIALILLVVLLIWFFVIRKKKDKPATKEPTGPPPNEKDYHVQENTIYSNTDKMNLSEASETLADDHVYEKDKAKGSRRHPKKGSKFLPSRGDATDQMDDELDEPYPPPPPPPPESKPNSQPAGLQDQLHYAELQHAVENSRTRRSKYIPRTETPYAEVEIAKLTKD